MSGALTYVDKSTPERLSVKRILLDGEDVTWRCVAADSEHGWCDLYRIDWLTEEGAKAHTELVKVTPEVAHASRIRLCHVGETLTVHRRIKCFRDEKDARGRYAHFVVTMGALGMGHVAIDRHKGKVEIVTRDPAPTPPVHRVVRDVPGWHEGYD